MGVHGLWDLLAPVGRRVSVETLAGKRLAIDASIWMIQFIKAMRDDKGEMVRNAHLIGFFRRICKLLFLRTKPVFVFDGATPALKRRTVIARRRQRENAQAKIRKTAEKLLMNHLKAMRLKNLAEDLKEQRVNTDKGKEAMSKQSKTLEKNDDLPKGYNQEMIDEMLVASILAEESGGLDGEASTSVGAINSKNDGASTSGATVFTEDEEDEDDEEMILPITNGNVDPAVLASLPPSMQLDLLVQMRERLMAENRQRYQKVKKAPQRFSELQIESYLKTVAFRREIDEVQKAAAGKGVGGVQTSRIASEANREFIFSSSFSGDKKLLASGGAENNPGRQQSIQKTDASLDIRNVIASASKSNPVARVPADEPSGDYGNEVETFVDERGRMRLSRRRAMGIRMTGDLERNIDLMKELEKETGFSSLDNAEIEIDKEKDPSRKSHCGGHSSKSGSVNGDPIEDNTEKSLLEAESYDNEVAPQSHTGISISINDDGEDGPLDAEDEFFSRLVAGKQVSSCSADNSASDCEWEEGMIFKQAGDLSDKNKLETNSSHSQDGNCESDVEWEDGTSVLDSKSKGKSFYVEDSRHNDNKLECRERAGDLHEYVSEVSTGSQKAVSKGSVEEEAALQEAIRRSLEDSIGRKTSNMSSEMDKSDHIKKTSLQWERCIPEPSSKLGSKHDNELSPSLVSKNNGSRSVVTGKGNCAATSAVMPSGSARAVTAFEEAESAAATSTLRKEGAQITINMGKNDTYVPTPVPGGGSLQVKSVNDTAQSEAASRHFSGEVFGSGTGREASALVEHELHTDVRSGNIVAGKDDGTLKASTQIRNGEKNGEYVPDHVSGADPLCATSIDDITKSEEAAYLRNSCEVYDSGKERTESVIGEQESHTDVQKNMAKEDIFPAALQAQSSGDVGVSAQDDFIELVGAGLEDELSALDQEYKDLGDVQRKLERNADSVNAEMFVECQELLQMFGLPYIIAPMEAEAQCAYMELANLVDGVVTDDSDVFLFGARSVYKNIFDDRKYVETYFMKDIESELGLSREKLIRMALLLGSDYTEGVSGIGIVNAIEVVNAFPEEDGLRQFREWVESPDPSILGKIGVQPGSGSKKRGSKASKSGKSDYTSDKEGTSISDCNALHETEDNQAIDDTRKLKQAFMDTHRNVSKNWHIPGSFPSDAVISAYTAPQVDKSTEPFAWGKPDIFLLRKVCWEKFGWASQKADELLLPVLKEYNKHETQLRLEAFYTFNERFAKIRSKRIKQAVRGITGKRSSELPSADDLNEVPEKAKRRKVSSKDSKLKDKELMKSSGGDGEMINSMKKVNSQRKRRDRKQVLTSDGGSTVLSSKAEERRSNNAGNSRVRGQRKGKAIQGGVRKDDSDSEVDETSVYLSSSSGSGTEYEHEILAEKVHTCDIVRRSKRARKDVNYAGIDEENERNVSPNRSSENCSIDKAAAEFQSENENVASPSKGIGLTSAGPSPGDYLVEGGGFCAEEEDQPEIEIDQVASIQNKLPSFEADKEYLQMGGGFCVDEDEDNQEENQSAGDPTLQSDLPIPTPPQSTSDTQALPVALELNPCDQNNTDVSTNVKSNDNEAPSSVSAFSAIPFLKRKRKN